MPAPINPDDTTYSGRFAARLRELRTKKRMTGEQAAEAITLQGFFVTPQTYYRWERNSRQVDTDALPSVAAAFGVSIRSLFPTS